MLQMDETTILGILVFYLISIIAVGLYSSRKIKSVNGFFLAERSLGPGILTATLTATVVGGSATIATAALIYRSGLPGLWLDIGGAVGLLVLAFSLAKLVRKTGLYTLPEITGHLFDKKTRFAAAILILLTQVAWIALLIQGTSTILSVLLPVEYELLLVGITLLFIFYTIVGGQFAVVYTDIIQFVIMIVGVCLLAAPLLLMEALPHLSRLSPEHLAFPINSSIGILPMASFFFMMLMPHIVGPDIYSKLLSAKDEKTARTGALFSGVFKLIFAIAIGVIAISAFVLVPGLTAPESGQALPLAITQLNPLLAGVILAAFVSVMLSSADSVLISAGTVLSVDIVRKKTIFVSRIGLLLIGLLALMLALYLNDIIATLKVAYTIFTAGLTLPIIFGFYKQKTKVTSTGAFLALILGGSISLFWLMLDSPGIDAVLVGLLVSLIPLIIFRKQPSST